MVSGVRLDITTMAKHTITLIPGDGIGPEIIAATVRIIEATGIDIEWETHILGAQAQEKFGTTLPESTIESIKRLPVALDRFDSRLGQAQPGGAERAADDADRQ